MNAVGYRSLRRQFAGKLLQPRTFRAAAELVPADVSIEILDLTAVPLFNQDLERTGLPVTVANLRQRVKDADGLLIATPEYNHTIPGVLGNTIDWLSRRTPSSPLRDKPVAIMGAARGGGSVRAQAACASPWPMRAAVIDGPVVALYNIDELATETGELVDPEARESVAKLLSAFAGVLRGAAS